MTTRFATPTLRTVVGMIGALLLATVCVGTATGPAQAGMAPAGSTLLSARAA